MALGPGSRLDAYELIAPIGSGGMADVWLAKELRLERKVALKLLPAELTQDLERVARFQQEARAASALNHPNVCTILALGATAEGQHYIAMEYVEGRTLRHKLSAGRLTIRESLDIAIQIAAALSAAHAIGVVHRDIKPENVMLRPDGFAKVLDFGLAKLVHTSEALDWESTLTTFKTNVGHVVGTIAYMSPEQARSQPVDTRTDIWSLGVVLYEMLSGHRPFAGPSTSDILAAILERDPDPLAPSNPDIDPELDRITAKCLEKPVDLRYRDIRDLLLDLRAAKDERTSARRSRSGRPLTQVAPAPPPATTITIPLPRVLATRRSRKLTAVTAVAAVVVGGGILLYRGISGPAAKGTTSIASAPAAQTVSLAILPFRNLSGDKSIDWLGSSMAEMLATTIGQSAAVKTVPAGRVAQVLADMRFSPNAALDPSVLSQLAQLSGANTVMWGQFVKSGDEIRIEATVQDVKHQRTIPVKAEAANERAIVGAIDQLAKSVRENLALSDAAVKQLAAASFKPSTTAAAALRYYNEGLERVRQGRQIEALSKFQAAAQEDNNFALAYAKLAETYAALGRAGEAEKSSREAVALADLLPQTEKYFVLASRARTVWDRPKAIEYYEKLEALLPNNDDVLLALANLHAEAGAYDKASRRLAKLLERDSKNIGALLLTARVRIETGKPEEALDFLNRALTLSIQQGNEEARAGSLSLRGSYYWVLNKRQEALRYFSEALALYRKLDHAGGSAGNLILMAEVLTEAGRSDEALKSYGEALALGRQIGDKQHVALVLNDLGIFFNTRGRYDEALSQYKEALQLQRELRNRPLEANALTNIGSVYVTLGNFEEGRTYLQQALVIREHMNLPTETADTLHNLAEASLKTGDYAEAAASYLKALDLRRQVSDKRGVGFELYNLGSLFANQGRYSAAIDSTAEALKIYKELHEEDVWLPRVLATYASALSQAGHAEQAVRVLREAMPLARALGNEEVVARILTAQGKVYYYQADYAKARTLYQQAYATLGRGKFPTQELTARLNLASVDVKEGRTKMSGRVLSTIAAAAERAGLVFESTTATILAAENDVKLKQYARARGTLEAALAQADRLGAKSLLAQAHYLMSLAEAAAGNQVQAQRHRNSARQLLETIRKDSPSDDVLRRSDLKPILDSPPS